MSRWRLLLLATIAIALGVGLFVAQALIGLNYYEYEDPWFLRAVQWLALLLLLASLPLLVWATVLWRAPRRDG